MKTIKVYDIPFVGLKQGEHKFEYFIDKDFFNLFDFSDFLSANIRVVLYFIKKTNLFELEFKAKGTVKVACDISNEFYDQPIEARLPLVVKFGEKYNDDNDEVLIITNESYKINVAQYIYEMIVLGVPSKLVHPGIIDRTLESEIVERLEEFKIESKAEIDPRWEKLKDLKK